MENLLYHRELSLKAFAVPDFITPSKNNGFITVLFFKFPNFEEFSALFGAFPEAGVTYQKLSNIREKKISESESEI